MLIRFQPKFILFAWVVLGLLLALNRPLLCAQKGTGTVEGVTDPSNVGGHGSNVTLPTKEALARDTASFGAAASGTNRSTPSNQPAGELPKVAASDFAGNLRAGRELLQAGRAKESLTYL